ncbi:polysaccharide deacetylase [Hyphomicrobium sp.]|uniref:polysaccharide deacetylase family protein n=1 Tax=Hyphomicrobium sp. TaxID=82 RepID=UPI001D228293|nr:polysaccharide deacetylase [Hyphomicrobium sp.]MBY0558780.1 polysaccharide deacetylase [Hyphomicrobium sp.]
MIQNPVPWPNGARCACAITFDIDTDCILHLEHKERAPQLVSTMSWLKYDEVAIPRILEMYRRFNIRQTFFYPAWCIERYPRLVEMILKDGHEIAAHGYLHENPNQLPPEEELFWLEKQIDIIKRTTGQAPRGWRAPLYNFSQCSAEYLARNGLIYDSSLMGDDIPYILRTVSGDVVELPTHWAMDDWPHYTHLPDMHYSMPIKAPDEAMNVFMSEFDAMWTHGGLWVTVWHPFVSGRLARCVRVSQMIEEMLDRGNVWFAPLEEIARHVKACIADGRWKPRVDSLPYYDAVIPELSIEPKRGKAA